MALHLALCSIRFRFVRPVRSSHMSCAFNADIIAAGRLAGQFFHRPCDPAQRRDEIGQVDHGKEQPDHPEQVIVGKKRQQAQHSHDFELQLLRLVRHSLWQGVQMQIKIADHQNGTDQRDANNDHQDIGVTGGRYEAWQMMGRAWMNGLTHTTLHVENESALVASRLRRSSRLANV